MDNKPLGNNESAKESDKSLSDLEQFFDNVTVDKTGHKPDSMPLLCEQMILNLQSKTSFLREQLKSKDIYFNWEILYLWNQLSDCSHRIQIKRDVSDFLFCVDKLNLLQKNLNSSLNVPSRELNLIEDHDELNKNVQYDVHQPQIKIKLIWVIVTTLIVPHTSTKVVQMISNRTKMTQ